jgi:hypothetical protein
VLEWLERIGRLGGWLLSVARSPLKIEVSQMSLERVRNGGGVLVVITPYPVRYRVAVRITNRSTRAVFIREICLRVAERTLPPDSLAVKRLDPDDYGELHIIFPVDDTDQPAEAGTFTIEVVPTRGRRARRSGPFPAPPPSA